jgi:hypothetical protein
MTTVRDEISRSVSVFEKPKKVKNILTTAQVRDVFETVMSFFHSAITTLDDFLADLLDFSGRLVGLDKAVEGL